MLQNCYSGETWRKISGQTKIYSTVVKYKILYLVKIKRALLVRSVGGQAPRQDINIIAFKYDDVARSN